MTRRSVVCLSIAGLLAIAICGYFITYAPARRALPWSASDIKEHRIDMFVDYAYYLRARMPPDDFDAYVQRLKLRAHTDEDMHLNWTERGLPSWWTATRSSEQVYSKRQGDHFIAAKYEDGHVFVRAWSH